MEAESVDEEREQRRSVDVQLRNHLQDVVRAFVAVSRVADPLTDLALNAAVAVAAKRGVPSPVEASRLVDDSDVGNLLAEERRWVGEASDRVVAAYVPMLARLTAGHGRGADRITSQALVDVVRTVISARPLSSGRSPYKLYDPALGTGSLLVEAAATVDVPAVLYGQDINSTVVSTAVAHAFLAQAESRFVVGDALLDDPFEGDHFDAIVSDPPYGMSWRNQAGSLNEERFPGGVPAGNDSTLLFAQIIARKLRPAAAGGGRAVMFCAPKPLIDSAGSPIREWLIDNDLIEALVALPEGLSADTDIRLFALVLNTAKPTAWSGRAQLVDLRGFFVDANSRDRRPERRRLSDKGLDELRRSLAQLKPSRAARPVELDRFRFEKVAVSHDSMSRRGGRASFATWLGPQQTVDQWADQRYQLGVRPQVETLGESEVRLDVATVFDDPLVREARRELERLGWPQARLPAIAGAIRYMSSAKAEERDAQVAALPPEQYIFIPVEAHADAVATDAPASAPKNRCLVVSPSRAHAADPGYLAAWLNSPGGRTVRAAAAALATGNAASSVRTFSQDQIGRFADELIIPLPPEALQREILETTDALSAAARAVAAGEGELWMAPAENARVRAKVRLPDDARDLAGWSAVLPYPLAGALWVYETEKHDPVRGVEHLVRFWEANAEFLGTILISALVGDPDLRRIEFGRMRAALAKVGLSLERATFGVWTIIVQRLSSTFRRELESDTPDAVEKMLQLFGNPPAHALARLLSPEIGTLIGKVNGLRNDWLGHAGATTAAQAAEQLEVLLELTDQLRDVTGIVWEDFRLIRPGRMARRDGKYHVDVELVRGPTAPFRRKEVIFTEAMDEGALYLTTLGAEEALRLNSLIVLRSAPTGATYTCYFYNRREGDGMRMIAYQYADESSVIDSLPELEGLLADFARTTD